MGRRHLPHTLGLCLLLPATFLVLAAPAATARGPSGAPRIVFASPVAGACYVRPGTGLIVRFAEPLEGGAAALPIVFHVTGARSGTHSGITRLARDRRTLLFQPVNAFAPGERVEVTLDSAAPLDPGALGAPARFSFTIAARSAPAPPAWDPSALGPFRSSPGAPDAFESPVRATGDIDPGYTAIATALYGAPAPGRLFLGSFSITGAPGGYLMIVGNAGGPVFARSTNQFCTDFKLQPDGRLTYYDTAALKFFCLDSTYAVIDSFECGNGVYTDLHELRLLPDGHALMMGIEQQVVDMSAVVPGGNPAAVVSGLVIQELDGDKNVVFQWRSWDHFQITDATHEDLTAATIDYVHGNALEVDTDGNLLLSSRHLDEITKIDRTTGDVLWRWGGKNNQFTLIGDTVWFSHQHAIRRLANGDVTLFDNGNFRSPPYSRAVEYRLDETQHTATRIWQYRNSPDIYGNAMGYVQRLDNGSTLISWGTGKPDVTEVAADGTKLMELRLPANISSYRVFRQGWGASELASAGPEAAGAIALSPGLPNPFRTGTTLFVNLPSASAVSVRVLDVQGRELRGAARVIREGVASYRVSVDLSERAAGVYFCRVSSAFGDQTRRLVHLN